MEMTIALVKETHTENKQVRFSIERNGQFVDGTLTVNETSAHRMYEVMKQAISLQEKNTIWKKEIIEESNI
jgi:hypothetical protein